MRDGTFDQGQEKEKQQGNENDCQLDIETDHGVSFIACQGERGRKKFSSQQLLLKAVHLSSVRFMIVPQQVKDSMH